MIFMISLSPIHCEKIWGYEDWIASTHIDGKQKEFFDFCKGEYPLLVKIIQANDFLSVQVHPDDKKAVELEGEGSRGKTECWYVLDAAKDAQLVYGFNKKYSIEEIRSACENGTLKDNLNFISVKKGDFIFIPSGTVHAIGGGMRLLEVQQSCNITYRLFDWNRGRELHLKKSLASIKNDNLMEVKAFEDFSCTYFKMKKIAVDCESEFKADGIKLIFDLNSEKIFAAKDEAFSLCAGEYIFISE